MQVKFLLGLIAGLATSEYVGFIGAIIPMIGMARILALYRCNPSIYFRYVNNGLYVA